MKKLGTYVLSILCGLCMMFGFAFALNTNTASAEGAQGTTPTLSTTKYKISKSQEHMLLATGIKDYEDVYEVGYAFKDMDGITKYHASTTEYYTSITSGSTTWTVEEMFGSEYTGMIVWEIAYEAAENYTYQAYAKVGDRVDGNLVTSDTIVYGTRKDLVADTSALTFVMNGGVVDGKTAVADKMVAYGAKYGELPTPEKKYAEFKGWYLNEDGTGDPITADTLVSLKGDHIVYAVYEDRSNCDFSSESQLDAFFKPVNVNYGIENGYLKVTKGVDDGSSTLTYKANLSAGATVAIDVEYVGENVAYASGNQITFLAYTANAAGDSDGKTTSVMGNASWDGGWDCKKTTVMTTVTEDCFGIRMQFVFNGEENAYFKITGIRIEEYPLVYDFEDASDANVFTKAQNTTYAIAEDANGNYLKVVGTHGSESTLVYKSTLKAGAIVEIDIDYVANDEKFVNGVNQVTFLAYTAKDSGSNDGVTTVVMGSAPWDGGWNCAETTIKVEVTKDCGGIRMQFVMNAEEGAYFKINAIRVFYPTYPTYTVTYSGTLATQEVTYGSAYGTLATAPSKDGYVFKGWYLNANGNGEAVTKDTIVNTMGDHALYAIYEEAEDVVEEEVRMNYDFATEDQAAEFSGISNGAVAINTNDGYLKLSPVEAGDVSAVNNPQAEFLFARAFTAGLTVEVDFELVGSIKVAHGVWTYGVNANKDNLFSSVYYTGWDTPDAWNKGKFTAYVEIQQDCAGIKFLVRFANNADAYWRINEIRIVEPVEYPIAYDFSDESQVEKFVSLDNGSTELVTDATGNYVKLYPTNTENLLSFFWFKENLKAGMTVEMDFELVGTINVAHGIWTYGAKANGSNLFDGQFVTGWDAKEVWNKGKFTSTTLITEDCYGVRIQVRYADNAEAYWKVTSVRIIDGEKPTSTVTYSANGAETTAMVTYGGKYDLPAAPAKANAAFVGWYLNADGTGKQITANTVVTATANHTVYAVYEEYDTNPDFFEADVLTSIVNYSNTKITHVKDATGNYIKFSPIEIGDTSAVNNPQSEFMFLFPALKAGMFVEMDFELVGAINVGHGVWTYGANASGKHLFDGQWTTAWDAGDRWNNGKFTATTDITQDCEAISVLLRYANNAKAYWKLTGIRVYTTEEYVAVPTYANDEQIDIGATSWLGTNATLAYFNGEAGEENFAKLQEAGITTLAGTFYGNTGAEEDAVRLLDMAAQYNVGLYFQQNWDGTSVPSYVSHEAFLGYYIDEPKQSDLASLKALQEKWNNSAFGANGKVLYVNLLPIYSSEAGNNYNAYVEEAVETCGLSVVSFDHYLMYYQAKTNIFNNITGYSTTLSYRKDWLQNFDVASYYAAENNVALSYTLLTTQHTASGGLTLYKDSTVADLEYQMYVAMTYGATQLVHYTFAGTGDYIIDGAMFNQNTGEWTQTYEDVKHANATIGEWDHVFMNFTWLGVSAVTGTTAQTGLINGLTHAVAVDNYGVLNSVTSNYDVLVGHFQDENGFDGIMITNLTIPEKNTSASLSLTFSNEYKAVIVYQDGAETLVYLKDGKLSLEVASAEGVFLIPVKAK